VTRGTIYRFRLQAKNIYGWGSFSSITAVAAAGIPQQIAIPTTTAQGANILVSWLEPYDESDPIKNYRLFVKGRLSDKFT